MSTLTIRPTGDNWNASTYTWVNQASSGVNVYASIDEEVLSEVDLATSGGGVEGNYTSTIKYNWADHSAESGTISEIVIYAQVKKVVTGSGGTTAQLFLFAPDSDHETEITLTTSSAQQHIHMATNPHTASAWTWEDIDALVAGTTFKATGSEAKNYTKCLVYQMYIEVEYSAAGWSNITKVTGVASADIAKVNGVAVASIAKVNGVAV